MVRSAAASTPAVGSSRRRTSGSTASASDQHALLLTTGKRPERLTCDVEQPDLVQTCRRLDALAPSHRAKRGQAGVRAHEHHLECGEREDRIEGLALRYVPGWAREAIEAVLDRPRE